jgi:hypothetical protein
MGAILDMFYTSQFACYIARNLDQMFPFTRTWSAPDKDNLRAAWLKLFEDPKGLKPLLNDEELRDTLALRNGLLESSGAWDRGERTDAILGDMVRQTQALLDKLPSRAELYKRLANSELLMTDYTNFMDGSRSAVQSAILTFESVERREDYALTAAKFELARRADLDGRPRSDLCMDPGVTPAAFWEGKGDFVPDSLKKANQDFLDALKTLEDPANVTRDNLAKLDKSYGELISGLSGRTKDVLGPLLAEAVRGVVGAQELSVAPKPGELGIARGQHAGPILSLTRMPKLQDLPPDERKDFNSRSEALNRQREAQKQEVSRELKK